MPINEPWEEVVSFTKRPDQSPYQYFLHLLSQIEIVSGLILFAFVVLIVIGTAGASLVISEWGRTLPRTGEPGRLAITICWPLIFFFGILSLVYYLGRGKRRTTPTIVQIAIDRPLHHVLLRLPIALWWLSLSALTLITVAWYLTNAREAHPTLEQKIVEYAAHFAMHLACTISLNTSFLIGIFSLTGSERIVRKIASVRLMFDVCVALILPELNLAGYSPIY